MNLTSMGGRRFVLTVVSGAGTWLLTALGLIDGGVYATVTIATVASYIGGNVAQRSIEGAANRAAK